MMGKYDDILFLEHPEPRHRKRMPMRDRAAQFSPFAALTGYEDAVRETARHTERFCELSEDEKFILNEKLKMLREHLASEPTVRIGYFLPDRQKSGGAYVCAVGTVRSLDLHERTITMTDRTQIPIDSVRSLESAIFGVLDMM